jgi:hypothetical protein
LKYKKAIIPLNRMQAGVSKDRRQVKQPEKKTSPLFASRKGGLLLSLSQTRDSTAAKPEPRQQPSKPSSELPSNPRMSHSESVLYQQVLEMLQM